MKAISKTEPHRVASRALALALGFSVLASVANAEPAKLGSKQSKLKGLLVRPLATGEHAGKASQMNATATPAADPGDLLKVGFNQDVGEMMNGALGEVMKFLHVRHDQLPRGHRIEIAFEDRYTPKDGPSAATACALMIESLISGDALDQKFAITGDMNADGSVQPVGGVPAKVRGAYSKECNVVAVPIKNARSLTDLILTEGAAPLARIQVFTVENFDQARALAVAERDEKHVKAITEFAMVQGAFARHGDAVLRNAKVQAKLREILALAPNHLSAELLLAKATGSGPRTLSLLGSLESIEKSAASLLQAARDQREVRDPLLKDELAAAVGGLRRVRAKLDRRTWDYADSIQDFGNLVREFQDAPPRGGAMRQKKLRAIQSSAQKIETEVRKIRNNKEMMEELMQ